MNKSYKCAGWIIWGFHVQRFFSRHNCVTHWHSLTKPQAKEVLSHRRHDQWADLTEKLSSLSAESSFHTDFQYNHLFKTIESAPFWAFERMPIWGTCSWLQLLNSKDMFGCYINSVVWCGEYVLFLVCLFFVTIIYKLFKTSCFYIHSRDGRMEIQNLFHQAHGLLFSFQPCFSAHIYVLAVETWI